MKLPHLTPAIRERLDEYGGELIRRNKHLVFQLRNGRRVVVSFSPSDRFAERKVLRDIEREGEKEVAA